MKNAHTNSGFGDNHMMLKNLHFLGGKGRRIFIGVLQPSLFPCRLKIPFNPQITINDVRCKP